MDGRGGKGKPIVLDDDDEDDDVVVGSDTAGKVEEVVAAKAGDSSAVTLSSTLSSTLSGLMGDRAQLEKERLERQRKRRREAGLPEDDEGEKMSDLTKAKKAKYPTTTQVVTTTAPSTLFPSSFTAPLSGKPGDFQLYWDGGVEKSYNRYCSQEPGQRFASFLLPTTPFNAAGLTHVIMTTYCEDLQWLATLFPKGPRGTAPEITMITHAPQGSGSSLVGVHSPLHPDLPNWVRLVIPRIKDGPSDYETQHMKFMFLFYPDRLRLLILSGNLVDYDWDRIENTAFIHDFRRRESPTTEEEGLGVDLRKVLDSLKVPTGHHAQRMLNSYDFSQTKTEARLVISRPLAKATQGWDSIEEWGLGRLGKVVRETLDSAEKRKQSQSRGGVRLEAQGSSMGTYSARWLQQVHILASGVDPRKGALPLPAGKKADTTWAKAVGGNANDKWPPIKLLFPSERWVKDTAVEGPPGAGTFFGKKAQSVSRGFVDLAHQPVSKRGDIMMHHKSLLALLPDIERGDGGSDHIDDEEVVGWIYMGSHNLTQAAWGNISSASASTPPQLTCQNWELGLVLPFRRRDLKADSTSDAAKIVTWKRPVEKYQDGDVPWDQFQQ